MKNAGRLSYLLFVAILVLAGSSSFTSCAGKYSRAQKRYERRSDRVEKRSVRRNDRLQRRDENRNFW